MAQPPPDPPGCSRQHRIGQVPRLIAPQPQYSGCRVYGGGKARKQHERGQVCVDDGGLVADPEQVTSQHGVAAENRADPSGARAACGEAEDVRCQPPGKHEPLHPPGQP